MFHKPIKTYLAPLVKKKMKGNERICLIDKCKYLIYNMGMNKSREYLRNLPWRETKKLADKIKADFKLLTCHESYLYKIGHKTRTPSMEFAVMLEHASLKETRALDFLDEAREKVEMSK